MSDPAVPDGLALAHSLWGEPDTSVTHSWTAAGGAMGAVQMAPASGVAYYLDTVSDPETRDARLCVAKDETCKTWKVHGSDFCVFHQPKRVDGEP